MSIEVKKTKQEILDSLIRESSKLESDAIRRDADCFAWAMECCAKIPYRLKEPGLVDIALPIDLRCSLVNYFRTQSGIGRICESGLLEQEGGGATFSFFGHRLVPGYEMAFVAFRNTEPGYFTIKISLTDEEMKQMVGYGYAQLSAMKCQL
jgi:hypothetical protein